MDKGDGGGSKQPREVGTMKPLTELLGAKVFILYLIHCCHLTCHMNNNPIKLQNPNTNAKNLGFL